MRVTLPSSHPGRATGLGCGTEISGAEPGAGLCTGLCQVREWLHGCCKGWEGHWGWEGCKGCQLSKCHLSRVRKPNRRVHRKAQVIWERSSLGLSIPE